MDNCKNCGSDRIVAKVDLVRVTETCQDCGFEEVDL